MVKKTQVYNYRFSFVIAVTDAADKLAETIESLIAQTMNFEQHCEIVLAYHGDNEAVDELYDRYASQFSENVQRVLCDSNNVNVLLNAGTGAARGYYVNYLRTGDTLSTKCIDEVWSYAQTHESKIDLVAVRMAAGQKVSVFDAKFQNSHIVTVGSAAEAALVDLPAVFIKASVVTPDMFDEALETVNDVEVIANVVAGKEAYGAVSRALCHAGISNDEQMKVFAHFKPWYVDTITILQRLLIESSSGSDRMSMYVQHVVMHALGERFKQKEQSILSESELTAYKQSLYVLLKRIEDSVILEYPQLSFEYGIFLLSKKHGKDIGTQVRQEGKKFFYGNNLVYDYREKNPPVHFDLFTVVDGVLRIEGFFSGLILNHSTLVFKVGKRELEATRVDRPLKHTIFLGDTVYTRNSFVVDIPLQHGADITVGLHIGSTYHKLPFVTRRNVPLNGFCNYSYWVSGEFVIIKRRDQMLEVREWKTFSRLKYELVYYAYLMRRLKLRLAKESLTAHKKKVQIDIKSVPKKEVAKSSAKELRWLLVPVKSTLQNLETIIVRLLYFAIRPFIKRKIWLISDRVDIAGDNGEAFFRYITAHPDENIRPYFVIDPRGEDFRRMKQYGRVIGWTGIRYKLLFLCADKIISSHASDFVTNPFTLRRSDFSDLFAFDFIFLQHGIIYNDLSRWLNRYNQDIDMFVTSVKPEYESILTYDYSYDKSVVKLTGIPRYDLLQNTPKNKLMLAPTWRLNLTGPIDMKTAIRAYNKDFKNTEYFKFYQGLIDDERIVAALKKHNMVGELYLHLSLGEQLSDFSGNDHFHIKDMPFDYRAAFCEGNIMVTDYSSIQFDFAYLKKPVIYTQFDKDSFYEGQNYDPGYFSFEENGFGPVTYDYESAVNEIVKSIESGGKLEDKYRKRIENFFYKFDQNNSQRVYEEIIALKAGKKES